MPNFGPVTGSPFEDYVGKEVQKDDNSNVSLQKEPGYKEQTPSPNIPSSTTRHSNMDGGKSVDLTDAVGPDAVKKRVG
jgi:hypothetical protein